MNEYGEMQINVTDSKRDVLYEVLSREYQRTEMEYNQAMYEYFATPNDATDDRVNAALDRLKDVKDMLTDLGFEIDEVNKHVRYKAASDG